MGLSRFTKGKYKGWIEPSLDLPKHLLEDPSRAAVMPGSETLLDCRGRRIYRIVLERSGSPAPCFLYLFRNSSLNRSFRRSYAVHICRMSEMLREAGFDTLEVLAAFRPKWQMLNWSSCLVARELQSVQELPSTGRHVYQLHTWAEFNTDVAAAVAARLADLHNSRFVHGDLKTRHILTRRNGGGSPPQILFVDLEKTKRIPATLARVHDFFAARDLVQLLASLPRELDGRTMVPIRHGFLEKYFLSRRLPASRQRLISRLLRLYEPGGGLRQGETVFRSLTAAMWKRVSHRDRLEKLESPVATGDPRSRPKIWQVEPGVLAQKADTKIEPGLEE